MTRILSNGLAAVGLAAVIALAVFMGGPGATKQAAADPNCGIGYYNQFSCVNTCSGFGNAYYLNSCNTGCGALYGGSIYGGCGGYSSCGSIYAGCGGYSGCGSLYGGSIYGSMYGGSTFYGGYGGNNLYGCGGGCTVYNSISCIPPSCGNAFGPILNCSNIYVPAGNIQYVAGRVSILPSASSVTCGGATAVTVIVADVNGFKVPDGTNVTFTTTLGYISASDQTIGGTAVTSLTIPPGTSGSARVTASSGGQSADTTINVTCASGAAPIAVQPLAALLPAPLPGFQRPAILPPSTGDAGLLID
jgi:hypothetical protein